MDRKRRVVIIDDDPTGCQTVRDVPVLLEWSVESLRRTLSRSEAVFILTNTRALESTQARDISVQVCSALKQVSELDGYEYTFISRSDSTLRGHLTEELCPILESFPQVGRIILAPAFFECGRITVNDTHYLLKGSGMIPTSETEFAKDPTFGYTTSYLPEWIEERSRGTFKSSDCISIPERSGDPSVLTGSPKGSILILNASDYRQMDESSKAIHEAEESGLGFIIRGAASIVRSYLGQQDSGFIEPVRKSHGLVVVGSYTSLTSSQVEYLRKNRKDICSIEIDVKRLLAEAESYMDEVCRETAIALRKGSCLLYTSRGYVCPPDRMTQLDFAKKVSSCLCEIVSRVESGAEFIIGKGGITSLTIARDALGIREATVVGQSVAGVPVWRYEKNNREALYVVFPGNVGNEASLLDTFEKFIQ